MLALVFSAIFWGLSAVFLVGIIRQAGTQGWPTADGEVTESKVVSQRGSKGGTTYKPEVHYRYSVGGGSFTSDTITKGLSYSTSSGGYARKVLGEFPAGKKIKVFYDAVDPSSSVLYAGMGEHEWQTVGFFGPFVCVPLILWLCLYGAVRSRGPGHVGTVPVMEPAPGIAVVRGYMIGPWAVGTIVFFFVLLAATLMTLIVFETGIRDKLLLSWGAALLLAAGAWYWRSRWIAAGRCDTVIDLNAGLLILPRGRKAEARSIELSRIYATVLKNDSSRSTNKRNHWRVHVRATQEKKSIPLVDIQEREDAVAFDTWLRGKLRLPDQDEESLAGAETGAAED